MTETDGPKGRLGDRRSGAGRQSIEPRSEKKRGDERRGEERDDCALDAEIAFEEHHLSCIVSDLSPTGVRIKIDPAAKVPERFDLLVPAVPGADQRFEVKMVWRRGDEIGGAFVTP